MIRAVIFDMYETLITHYACPLYFGAELAADAGVDRARFLALWRTSEEERTLGWMTLEQALRGIFRALPTADDEQTVRRLYDRRLATKRACFRHLHPGILPMLDSLRGAGLRIGLISNCYDEEAVAIRESALFPCFDAAMLSCEQQLCKPDPAIFMRCLAALDVRAEECLYVGDGGSRELETARSLGMEAVQALWYMVDDPMQIVHPMAGFRQLTDPMQVLEQIERPESATMVGLVDFPSSK